MAYGSFLHNTNAAVSVHADILHPMRLDRAYLTATEWKEEWGGKKVGNASVPFRRLPFHCCAISFLPFEDAVCTRDGSVFELTNAVPYVRAHKKHPVLGTPLELRDLIRLHWHRNADGEYCCPVLGKVFTPHSRIAAVATSGHVYSYEALEELCFKPRNLRDLLTDEPFARRDVIDLQNPLDLEGRDPAGFDHVLNDLKIEPASEGGGAAQSALASVSGDAEKALAQLGTRVAEDALRAGGGSAKAQAERLLADARAKEGGVG
ncbi:hypothetical protein H632_c768p0, partial [Helicosporidium sp. ATCC 50920]